VVSLWFRDTVFGGILGIAMLAVLTIAALLGTLVPLFLKRIRIDPAIATGPFITTSNDIIGLTIYFTIIHLVL
jgi:magnesium transporter